MHFQETNLSGAFVIDLDMKQDERGFFARTFCQEEFAAHGLEISVPQCNISFNRRRGTLRGMHFNRLPHQEAKLVRCTAGGIYDVIVDLRPESPTFLQHVGVELTAANRRMLYVPKGFAHGFQCLADETEVFYQMSENFVADVATGLRYDDAALGITWPLAVSVIADRDRSYADFAGPADERLLPLAQEVAG